MILAIPIFETSFRCAKHENDGTLEPPKTGPLTWALPSTWLDISIISRLQENLNVD